MKKNIRLNSLLLFLPLLSLVFCFNSPKNDEEKMQTIMISVKNTLEYLHYSPKSMDDEYSKNVYSKYFEMIDPAKRFFLESDMKEFSIHKNKLSDYLKQGDLSFYNFTISRLYERIEHIDQITQEILGKPINLEENEIFIIEPKKKVNPKDREELVREWKKYIKYSILQEIESLNAKEESQQKKKDSVVAYRLTDTIKVEKLSFSQKKQKATEEIKNTLQEYFARFKKRKKMNWFGVYMNAYTEVFDPHTNYFSPVNKEEFDIRFKGKVIGIGAVIQEKRGNLFLGPLTIGAPAWKSKRLTEGDKILKVRPTPKDDFVKITGMLVDEAVRLIRGSLGSEVTLVVEKKDKSVIEVKMIREEVSIEDTFARSIVISDERGKKYGLINLPSFNTDFDDEKGRNASDDVKAELIKLKEQNVEGILLDLRGNGGGSLTEVGDIMGLFMKSGPYVQVKSRNGKTQTLKNKNNEPIWIGPLVILQNELSASASEILAGQMQDYGRAVIVGSPHSYGKGTVQTFVDLKRFLSSNDDFGSLKLTIQKFYRVTGESTQKEGVNADVEMKNIFSFAEIGEKYDEYALPWDKIDPVEYTRTNEVNLPPLKKASEKRIAANKNYRLLLESVKWRESLSKEESIPLNYERFFQLIKKRKDQIKKFKILEKYENGLRFSVFPKEMEREKKEEAFKKKTENWVRNLKRDLILQEAVYVLSDLSLQKIKR
ncbi:MAG: tail-specific protease [Bergeyella sp.]|nr:tail-specific protease [Bergeyella sp.]